MHLMLLSCFLLKLSKLGFYVEYVTAPVSRGPLFQHGGWNALGSPWRRSAEQQLNCFPSDELHCWSFQLLMVFKSYVFYTVHFIYKICTIGVITPIMYMCFRCVSRLFVSLFKNTILFLWDCFIYLFEIMHFRPHRVLCRHAFRWRSSTQDSCISSCVCV